jgi:hypothetical protein
MLLGVLFSPEIVFFTTTKHADKMEWTTRRALFKWTLNGNQ